MIGAQLTGTRLEYVVVPIPEPVKRRVVVMQAQSHGKNAKGEPIISHRMVNKLREQPGGFMVFFPRGHCLRIGSQKELRRYRLDQQPRLINLEGLNDPNSPIGKLMMAQDDRARRGAMESLEKQVIQIVNNTTKGGSLLTQVEELPQED